ncbi:MAG: hypothetical protein H0W30_19160 [Gemmatimonadaceae bacterium]|nr:hypothetical protein [Gemmatimonadaceae bacterium]MDQ3518560.1 S41 family peptidase [Gemmatimonadota bacterium]
MRIISTTSASLNPFSAKSRPAARARVRLPAPAELRAAGFEQLNHLAGNIGYLDIRSFEKIEAGAAVTAAVLDFFSDTVALLMDLRRHEAGDTAAASLLASHFFDTELVHLEAEYWTPVRRQRAFSALSSQGSRYIGPSVYVLIGKHSSAVAVGFARMLQGVGRATIVGESPANGTISADLPVAEEAALVAAHRAALKPLPSVA